MKNSIFYDTNQYNYGRITLLIFVILAVVFGCTSLGIIISHQNTTGLWVLLTATFISVIGAGYFADQYTIVVDSVQAIEQFQSKECYSQLKGLVTALNRPLTYEELRRISSLT